MESESTWLDVCMSKQKEIMQEVLRRETDPYHCRDRYDGADKPGHALIFGSCIFLHANGGMSPMLITLDLKKLAKNLSHLPDRGFAPITVRTSIHRLLREHYDAFMDAMEEHNIVDVMFTTHENEKVGIAEDGVVSGLAQIPLEEWYQLEKP